jgi:hypothetical protein
MADRSYEAFKNDLGHRESTNNYACKNKWGFLGRWQFGKPRLCDLGLLAKTRQRGFMWLWGLTEEAFLGNPHLQTVVFDVHVARLRAVALAYFQPHLERLTVSGAVAVMHIQGPGGLRSLVEGEDRADALGTPASEYLALFSGYNIPSTLPTQFNVQEAIAKGAAKNKGGST